MGLPGLTAVVYFIPMSPRCFATDPLGWLVRWAVGYHVAVIVKSDGHPFIVVQPEWVGISVFTPTAEALHLLLDNHEGVATAFVKLPVDPPLRRYGCGIVTCVEVVKRTIGMHRWWVQTPRQLMKALKPHG